MSMNCECFTVNPLQENSYIVWDGDTLDAAIIDCGVWTTSEENMMRDFVRRKQLHLIMALQTHMHFDHIWGLPFLHREYGLSPICHSMDQRTLELQPLMIQKFGIQLPSDIPPVERFVGDGEIITLGSAEIHVIHTPGHSEGSVCFYIPSEKWLFTGDTLFQGSYGRTDFDGGSMSDIVQSLHRLSRLPDDTLVFPGHGSSTTLGKEKKWI